MYVMGRILFVVIIADSSLCLVGKQWSSLGGQAMASGVNVHASPSSLALGENTQHPQFKGGRGYFGSQFLEVSVHS